MSNVALHDQDVFADLVLRNSGADVERWFIEQEGPSARIGLIRATPPERQRNRTPASLRGSAQPISITGLRGDPGLVVLVDFAGTAIALRRVRA